VAIVKPVTAHPVAVKPVTAHPVTDKPFNCRSHHHSREIMPAEAKGDPPTHTPFKTCSRPTHDHLRWGHGGEEPVVALMSSRDAWREMGLRFKKARKALFPSRRMST
jgi:hypothetical protein